MPAANSLAASTRVSRYGSVPRQGCCPASCYDSNISPTYRGRPVGLQMSNSVQWTWRFALSDTSCPTRPSVLMFSFLLQLKYFSDLLWTSGRILDVGLCAMAAAFFHYRTTCAQFGRVFRCFSFHNISPFLLPDLFSLLPCLSN